MFLEHYSNHDKDNRKYYTLRPYSNCKYSHKEIKIKTKVHIYHLIA